MWPATLGSSPPWRATYALAEPRLTTRYVADPETLARAGVTGVNFALSMTATLLDQLAAQVAAGSIVPPPITRVSLDDVPAMPGRHTEGKTVITM